jgi:PRMT5 arginine-N-methyltransferase
MNTTTPTTTTTTNSHRLILGLCDPACQRDAAAALTAARADGFDYVTTQIPPFVPTAAPATGNEAMEEGEEEEGEEEEGNGILARTDITALSAHWWRTCIVGRYPTNTTTVMTAATSSSNQQQHLEWQLQWAHHMGLPAVILPALHDLLGNHKGMTTTTTRDDDDSTSSISPSSQLVYEAVQHLQRLSHQAERLSSSLQLWIPVPLRAEHAPWMLNVWTQIGIQVATMPNVGLLLEFVVVPSTVAQGSSSSTATTDTTTTPAASLQLYSAQLLQLVHNLMGCGPVKAVVIPTNVFLLNRHGFPTLSKVHQNAVELILARMGRTVKWLVDQQQRPPTAPPVLTPHQLGRTGCLPHYQYLQHVRQRPVVSRRLDTPEAELEADYLDALQKPLQPLKDHLLNATYDTFEQDPIKYDR